MFTGCATSTLLNKGKSERTRTEKVVLVEDNVVAFGKMAQQNNQLPADSLVIAGTKNSYVLTQGGARFVSIIGQLDPKHIQLTRELNFYSAKNDGHFSGVLPLSYVKLQENVSKKDLEFFLENAAEECTTSSDKRMNAQRFCFNIKLSGVVYPVVNNLNSLKPLSKPYPVSIYTQTEERYTTYKNSGAEKLVLFPFAVAFDVVTLPFQAISKIFD
ncbi:hypothetical protein [Acinetobacter rudis]|uniref:Lipoprotein n=1 Tax=Acinetobacter rudis TaxID=632955 RepID=A0AAW8JCC2_9GAMM|nr:hypothetical protein [Acinetobacter rudis]MDQ8937258.1 hypothetical protein [Acinetobacter rudis]MDQ8953991.1 hypothetical protein [Acinetobacter rudis]MDQ9019458.1 hypothetical protein [Acinetobacter rudis]